MPLQRLPTEKQPEIWPLVMMLVGIPIVAVATGYFFASVFFCCAVCFPALFLYLKRDQSLLPSESASLAATSLILIGLGILFVIPWTSELSEREKMMWDDYKYCLSTFNDRDRCELERRRVELRLKMGDQK